MFDLGMFAALLAWDRALTRTLENADGQWSSQPNRSQTSAYVLFARQLGQYVKGTADELTPFIEP